jgi:CDP-diacylglycerol pyrophosphatase
MLLMAILNFASSSRAADPDALWRIVQGQCLSNQALHHNPEPCTSVDVDRGFALLKDRRGVSQFLLLPTIRVSGIEDPLVLSPRAPAYWQAAWQARHLVAQRLGRQLPAAWLSLAVNSAPGRSQNQLHIHIDCVAAELPELLANHAGAVGPHWTTLPVALNGHVYRIRSVATLDSETSDPFRLAAAEVGGAAAEMARVSIAVVGIGDGDAASGFYVLETRADALNGNPGSAEELQDHDCALARGP